MGDTEQPAAPRLLQITPWIWGAPHTGTTAAAFVETSPASLLGILSHCLNNLRTQVHARRVIKLLRKAEKKEVICTIEAEIRRKAQSTA